MGRRRDEEPGDSTCQVEVLRSFLDAIAEADMALFHRSPASNTPAPDRRYTAARLKAELRRLSFLPVETLMGDGLAPTDIPPGLIYVTMNALVRLVEELLSEDPASACNEGDPTLVKDTDESSPVASTLVDLALLCLTTLLEDPPWRHVFFRVLHELQLEPRREKNRGLSATKRGDGGREPSSARLQKQRSSRSTLQERLWRKIITDATTVTVRDNGAATVGSGVVEAGGQMVATSSSTGALVSPVNRHAVRLCCNMVRHCPLSFPASSYSSLAPHLVDHLIDGGRVPAAGSRSGRGDSGGTTITFMDEASEVDLMVLLDLFAACVRGSPHFRQCVKGIRRKRELFRRLLAFLAPHPRHDGRVLVRALCGLTRVLAGDALEAKVFTRGNALETASLVMENLLDVSGSIEQNGRSGGACRADSAVVALGEKRRLADVASDIARSRVFTSVLLETGRLASFLRDAVAVIARVAAEMLENGDGRRSLAGLGSSRPVGGASSLLWRGGPANASRPRRVSRPEPLLRALCSFCLEHSPARSIFIQALLGLGRESTIPTQSSEANLGTTRDKISAAPAATAPSTVMDPCTALFVLCGHPHQPTASAASALVQCLLVGGGALGAVSGPSPGAAPGVGMIPAGYYWVGWAGTEGAGGIGRQDPLQAALLKKMSAVALGRRGRQGRRETDRNGSVEGFGRGEDLAIDAVSVADFSDCSDSEQEVDGGWCANLGLDEPIGLAEVDPFSRESSAADPPPAALFPILQKLGRIAAGLASAREKQDLTSCDGSRGQAGRGLRARAIEAEQELTSILCLLSSSALASSAVARVLARTLSLEASLASILAIQRDVLVGTDPADYPRSPVEIVLVSLTLVAQLALALGDRDRGYCGRGLVVRRRRRRGIEGHDGDQNIGEEESGFDSGESLEVDREEVRLKRGERRGRNRMERESDSARAAALRRFLGEKAAAVEVKLCVGHAACRAESKDLARRVASLISLLQAGGGADALLVADALYSFAQSAEARELGLRSRAEAAEAAAYRERAAGARRAAALEEAEELVAQMEARNAEELRRVSEEEKGARRRLQEAHARALARGQASLRRTEETMTDIERTLRAKEDALRGFEREARAKDLELASLRGDLTREARLRTASEFKLEEARSQREQLRECKVEAEKLVESTKADLREAYEGIKKTSAECEAERVAAKRAGVAARETEEELKRSNARTEEAYGKLILLARSYKALEDESQCNAAETEELLARAISQTKAAQAQTREEERRHRLTKAAVKDAEAALQRTEERLVKVSAEAAQAQAMAAAARAAAREATREASASAREAALRRDETAKLKAELERSRAACAEKDLQLEEKRKELGQQAGIIEYINKLSRGNISDNGEAAPLPERAVTVHADRVASVPNSEESRS